MTIMSSEYFFKVNYLEKAKTKHSLKIKPLYYTVGAKKIKCDYFKIHKRQNFKPETSQTRFDDAQ